MIEKIVLPSSFQFDEPVAKLIGVCAKGLDLSLIHISEPTRPY